MALLDDLAGLIIITSIVGGKAFVEAITEVVQGPALVHVHVTTQIQTLVNHFIIMTIICQRLGRLALGFPTITHLLGVEVPLIVPEVDPLGPVLHQVLSVHTLNPEGHIAAAIMFERVEQYQG